MKRKAIGRLMGVAIAANSMLGMVTTRACTSIVVSRGASKDGSVIVTYSADAPFMPRLLRVAGGTHSPGTMVEVRG